MKYAPRGFGGHRIDPETIKKDGWREFKTLVISADDQRLTWPERELIEQLGARLYGSEGRKS